MKMILLGELNFIQPNQLLYLQKSRFARFFITVASFRAINSSSGAKVAKSQIVCELNYLCKHVEQSECYNT